MECRSLCIRTKGLFLNNIVFALRQGNNFVLVIALGGSDIFSSSLDLFIDLDCVIVGGVCVASLCVYVCVGLFIEHQPSSSTARFQRVGCSAAIKISADLTQATFQGRLDTSHKAVRVLCTLPLPQADGSLVVRFRVDAAGSLDMMPFCGWALEQLPSELKSIDNIDEMGCFLGLDPHVLTRPPLEVGNVLTLRYRPAQGLILAQVHGAAEFEMYSDLPNRDDDVTAFRLVPAVVLRHKGDVVSLLD
jgi:hypothetical protein